MRSLRRMMWPSLVSPLLASPLAVRVRRNCVCAGRTVVLAVAGGLLVAGCAAGSYASGTSATSGGNLGIGVTLFKDGAGPLVPAVAGTLLDGQKFKLSSYHGHVVVLNLWGSWCSVCRGEAPDLSAAASYFKAAGVRFLGVDVQDELSSADAYMHTFRISYPSMNDPGDKIALDFRDTIPIADFPSTLVISRNGRIVARVIGGVTYRELKILISKAEAKAA